MSTRRSTLVATILLASACAPRTTAKSADPMDHMDHMAQAGDVRGAVGLPAAPPATVTPVRQDQSLPAGFADAAARLGKSPRHGEWAMIASGPAPTDSIRLWVVYPERKTRAPVVIVIHEIFGMSTWVRAVTDQLAADGYIAIAPDLLTSKKLAGAPDSVPVDSAVAAIRTLNADWVQQQLDAVAKYGMSLPAALRKYGVVGFCWGGSTSFAHAVHAGAGLGASVVYYGGSPRSEQLASVSAPVLGLYGENDARVDATIPGADSAMKALGKVYEHYVFTGAGHGFLRAQDGQNGANLAAAREAWPKTIAWFRKYLGA
jgi:carboxymethylenebutenolidase